MEPLSQPLPTLGVCYYPEHWPESTWAEDARRMRDTGLTWVRIGEFAWKELEPQPGRMDWAWLDRAIDTLANAGLKVVLGTPTATPPKWLVDRMPDMLPVGRDGRVRQFGSRRHYDFSHPGYRLEAARIAAAMAERYGRHPAVAAWQIDNEYGCHDTIRSAGPIARAGFQRYLEAKYGSVAALNEAWWNQFWSMSVDRFDEVELPVGAVTHANPSAILDYYRFASAAAVEFHKLQVDEIRPRSPGRPITHNAMIFFADLDSHALGRELDIITWDSYPLGMLEQSPLPEEVKNRYLRTGHPDLIAFNHDLYRGALEPAAGEPYQPFWVMEQQPGQVNWAPSNPLPAPGAVRLWSHQAIAHGADVVSYFRWRAAVGAGEHLHAGLLQHDRSPDQGLAEAAATASDLQSAAPTIRRRAPVALLLRYEDLWIAEIEPHAAHWRPWSVWVEAYSALRSLGLDVDILPPDRDLTPYRWVVAPSSSIADEALAERLQAAAEAGATVVLGPRSGAYRPDMRVHTPAPGPLAALSGVRIGRFDGLRPGVVGEISTREPLLSELPSARYGTWADLLEPSPGTEVWGTYSERAYAGVAALTMRPHGAGRVITCGAALEGRSWAELFAVLARQTALPAIALPEGVRLSRHAGRPLLQNFSDESLAVDLRPIGGPLVDVPAIGVTWVDLPEAP